MSRLVSKLYFSMWRRVLLFGHLVSQQCLPGSCFIPSAWVVLPLTIFVGLSCIALGLALQSANSDVKFLRIPYACSLESSCDEDFQLKEPWKGKVYFYYRLEYFYKSHRRFQRNLCVEQLTGMHPRHCANNAYLSSSLHTTKVAGKTKFYAPMGANAGAMFNDVFSLTYLKTGETVPLTKDGITSKAEESYYSHYAHLANDQNWCEHDIFKETVKPEKWKQHICEMGGYKNPDFIVWMRPVVSRSFKKLHRILVNNGTFKDGLPAGDYRLHIENHYNMSYNELAGKAFEMLRPSWYGAKDHFLSICSLVVGIIYLILGLLLTFLHLRKDLSKDICDNI